MHPLQVHDNRLTDAPGCVPTEDELSAIGFDLPMSAFFYNFAVRFTKSCIVMNSNISKANYTLGPVRNWGFKENWKSTASI